jgi:uncharacterized Zn finger protein
MRRWGYWDDYKKPARKVKGGIKAQSKQGSFGQSWWAKRWIAVLESFDIGARLGRGRTYARKGQVMGVDITHGSVQARVQGSAPKPYKVSIEVTTLPAAGWKKLALALSREALFAAKLLAGEMPQEIEQVFTQAGQSLFPAKLGDLKTSCSCPDWSNPCKHVAAVYYLLGEEFDRDPFLIFKLRGMSREGLIELLGTAGATTGTVAPNSDTARALHEAISTDADSFWRGGDLSGDQLGEVNPPPTSAALPKRLGTFPFWRGTERFLESIEPVYSQASILGLDTFLGLSESSRRLNRDR